MANYYYDDAVSFSAEPLYRSDDSSDEQISSRGMPTFLNPSIASGCSSSVPQNNPPPLDHHHRHDFQRLRQQQVVAEHPVIVTRDNGAAVNSTVLEIPGGFDIIDSIVNFAHRFRVGVSVISAVGSVCNVTLCHPFSQCSLSLNGPFNLLSLSGSFLAALAANPNSVASLFASSPFHTSPSFGISVIGTQGQEFSGTVAGRVTAASLVVVVLATYSNPTFYRVPNWIGDRETRPSMAGYGATGEISTSMPMFMPASVSVSVPTYGLVNNPTPIHHNIPLEFMHRPPSVPPFYFLSS